MNERAAVLDLESERHAAEALRDALSKIPNMDEGTIVDSIEGETNLHETIINAVAYLTETEAMLEGLDAKITQFEARKKRYSDRKAFLRSAIEQAMFIGGIKTKELPDCTLFLSHRAPGVVIADEARVPAAFWKPRDPELDKKAIAEALKAKLDVPGATLGNGGVSLTIRRA